jgi:hypothetical protein
MRSDPGPETKIHHVRRSGYATAPESGSTTSPLKSASIMPTLNATAPAEFRAKMAEHREEYGQR